MKTDKIMEQIQVQRDEQFRQVVESAAQLFHRKNMEYRDAIRMLGLIGAVSEIAGSAVRLIALVYHSEDFGASKKDQIEDILLDLLNYAVIGKILLDEENYNGVMWQ